MTIYGKVLRVPAHTRLALAMLIAWILGGCAASPDYTNYLTAQTNANMNHVQKPLLVLEGHNGQPITGLARVEVNMPTQAPVIQQARPNEWAGVASQALGVVGVIGGVMATGKAMSGVAEAVGQSSTVGYQYVQTPQANVTTTTTTTTTDNSISGSYNPSTVTDNHSNQNNPVTTTYPMVTP